MTAKEYNIFYKTDLSSELAWRGHAWDIFASAFNSSERVRIVFDKVNAREKYWLIHSEYDYQDHELPHGRVLRLSTRYARETSHGLSRVWLYTVEYPIFG